MHYPLRFIHGTSSKYCKRLNSCNIASFVVRSINGDERTDWNGLRCLPQLQWKHVGGICMVAWEPIWSHDMLPIRIMSQDSSQSLMLVSWLLWDNDKFSNKSPAARIEDFLCISRYLYFPYWGAKQRPGANYSTFVIEMNEPWPEIRYISICNDNIVHYNKIWTLFIHIMWAYVVGKLLTPLLTFCHFLSWIDLVKGFRWIEWHWGSITDDISKDDSGVWLCGSTLSLGSPGESCCRDGVEWENVRYDIVSISLKPVFIMAGFITQYLSNL